MSQVPFYPGTFSTPGISATLENFQNQFWDQFSFLLREQPVFIHGSARDSGNTAYTTLLRAGLAIGGPIDASATGEYMYKQWDVTATDGSQFLAGFLKYEQVMVDGAAANQNKYCPIVVAGDLYSDRILIAGEAALGMTGNNYEALLQQGFGRFNFDRHLSKRSPLAAPLPLMALSILGASPNTLTAAHMFRTWTNTGDIASRTVNLPVAPIPGQKVRFVRIAAQNIVIDGGTPTIIGIGNVAADTLTLASAGAFVEFEAVSTTQWLVINGGGTMTLA